MFKGLKLKAAKGSFTYWGKGEVVEFPTRSSRTHESELVVDFKTRVGAGRQDSHVFNRSCLFKYNLKRKSKFTHSQLSKIENPKINTNIPNFLEKFSSALQYETWNFSFFYNLFSNMIFFDCVSCHWTPSHNEIRIRSSPRYDLKIKKNYPRFVFHPCQYE